VHVDMGVKRRPYDGDDGDVTMITMEEDADSV